MLIKSIREKLYTLYFRIVQPKSCKALKWSKELDRNILKTVLGASATYEVPIHFKRVSPSKVEWTCQGHRIGMIYKHDGQHEFFANGKVAKGVRPSIEILNLLDDLRSGWWRDTHLKLVQTAAAGVTRA